MQPFKDYFNYYQNLRDTPSDEYLEMGEFGKCCWDQNICEGLITSFPQEKVVEFIEQLSTGDDYEIFKNYDKSLIKIIITPINNSIGDIIDLLNGKLKMYGYKIGRKFNPNHFGQYSILIEPIHSIEVDPSTIPQLYHLTHQKHLNKIKELGLSPRESTTLFTHPGGRIYLFSINDEENIEVLKKELTSKTITKNDNYPSHLQAIPTNMVTLKIKQPYTFKLFEDPMFGGWQNFKGYFTTDNISSNLLEIIH